MSGAVDKALQIAGVIAQLEPQIGTIVQLVQGGYMGYKAVRAFFADQGHDNETLDAIITEFDGRIARWKSTTFVDPT